LTNFVIFIASFPPLVSHNCVCDSFDVLLFSINEDSILESLRVCRPTFGAAR